MYLSAIVADVALPEKVVAVKVFVPGRYDNGVVVESSNKSFAPPTLTRSSSLESGYSPQFSNNLLHDEENYPTFLNKDQLSGLSESYINAAASSANWPS
mgnify:CR=1 FL=1